MKSKNNSGRDQEISRSLLDRLKKAGADFFVTFPCKLLGDLIVEIENDPDVVHVPVTREEEGVGIAAGAYLGGKSPVMVIQNSGIGNSINALASLTMLYRMPLVLVLSHRGTEGEKISAQVPMGRYTRGLLSGIGVKVYRLGKAGDLNRVRDLAAAAFRQGKVIAFLLPFSFWKEVPDEKI